MTHNLSFSAYCGMTYRIAERIEESEARACVALKIRRARKRGQRVTVLDKGEAWEFETPEDAAMVSDDDGVLRMKEATPRYRCGDCGTRYHDRDDAGACCAALSGEVEGPP